MFDAIMKFFNSVDDVMYYPILIIVLAAAGLFFTFRTRFVQLRLFGTACNLSSRSLRVSRRYLPSRH